MEGPDVNGIGGALALKLVLQPLAHFLRRLAGKCHGGNGGRIHLLFFDQVGDTADKGLGFARPRPGNNRHCRVIRCRSLPLLAIEAIGSCRPGRSRLFLRRRLLLRQRDRLRRFRRLFRGFVGIKEQLPGQAADLLLIQNLHPAVFPIVAGMNLHFSLPQAADSLGNAGAPVLLYGGQRRLPEDE